MLERGANYHAERVDGIIEHTLKGDYDPAAARVATDGHKWLAAMKSRRFNQAPAKPDGEPDPTVRVVIEGGLPDDDGS